MNWISPSFCGDDAFNPPPKKKTKTSTSSKPQKEPCSLTEFPSCNWLEKHKPKCVDDLVVNVKKVQEVEGWFQQALNPKSAEKFLLLTGPSGCGKTATLETVSKRLGIKVLEWITPLDRPVDDFNEFPSKYEYMKSSAKQFQEYVFRSSRYNSCFMSNPTKKLVLVKDFPNVFIHNPSSFQEMLERFSEFCINPVVFICSDESLCRKLFSSNMKASSLFHTVTFNPIPEQKLLKSLKTILSQEVKLNEKVKMLNEEALRTICAACQGDMRSAVSKLYFCSINSDFDISQLKSQGKFKKPKTSKDSVETDKDKRLDFFHGIGRVLYPKKIKTISGIKFVHSSTEIVENFLCEPKRFLNQLHENYPSKMGNIYDLRDAAERLSKSDILMSRWQEKDIFHEFALSVSVQGLMVANRNPQKAKFEAFKKSQASRLEIDTKAIELEGKALFSDLYILEYDRLIDLLPYCTSLLPNLNQGQLEYVRKTCQFG